MQKTLITLSLLVCMAANAQTPCVDGMAGDYPCERVDLLSFIPIGVLTDSPGLNDIWGWVDPMDNKEYAIVGTWTSTAFVDITDPVNPIFLGSLPSQEGTFANTWRDIKVYNDFAFIVADNVGNHGMQVFDLTKLRDVVDPPVTFEQDAHYDGGIGSAHNIIINDSQPYAYIVGCSQADGGPVFIDISDPLNPTLAGSFSELGYSHDGQVVTYDGPDVEHVGKEIYFGFHGSSENGFVIVDVSDKSDPETISTVGYDCNVYTHQGWVSDDGRFCFLNDEIDEGTFGYNTRTRIFNIEDLDNPVHIGQHISGVTSTDHNLYIDGDYAYMSNYSSGLRVVDFSRIDEGITEEVAHFDVHPGDNEAGYHGTWSNYPYFPSGTIVMTHRETGLFMLDVHDLSDITPTAAFDTEICPAEVGVQEYLDHAFSMSPNPAQDMLSITGDIEIHEIQIMDASGRLVQRSSFSPMHRVDIEVGQLAKGIYSLIINQSYRGGQLMIMD